MRTIIIIAAVFSTIACNSSSDRKFDILTIGVAKSFSAYGLYIPNNVESSVIGNGDTVENFYDRNWNGNFDHNFSQFTNGEAVETINSRLSPRIRFSYVFKHANMYYAFGWRDHVTDASYGADIFMWKSENGTEWELSNSENPVLTCSSDPQSIFFHIWNVGADIDESGTCHMFVECADESLKVGLAYVSAPFSESMSFDVSKQTNHVCVGGGNPYVYYQKSLHSLLVIHGMIDTENVNFSAAYWWTGASIYNIDTQSFITKFDKFSFGYAGTHICDPHATEFMYNGKTSVLVSFSYDQCDTYYFVYSGNMNEFINSIHE